jgi:hypothetical protein
MMYRDEEYNAMNVPAGPDQDLCDTQARCEAVWMATARVSRLTKADAGECDALRLCSGDRVVSRSPTLFSFSVGAVAGTPEGDASAHTTRFAYIRPAAPAVLHVSRSASWGRSNHSGQSPAACVRGRAARAPASRCSWRPL